MEKDPNDNSISKRKLWHFVNKKINRVIHHYHVLSVITLLFDEIIADLKRNVDLKIHNLGTLTLKTLKPRRYFDVTRQQVMQGESHRILRFNLAPKFRKKLIRHLDWTPKDD